MILDACGAALLALVLAATLCLCPPKFLWFQSAYPNLIVNSLFCAICWSGVLWSVINGNRFLLPVLRAVPAPATAGWHGA